jgi:hypothetical protein
MRQGFFALAKDHFLAANLTRRDLNEREYKSAR